MKQVRMGLLVLVFALSLGTPSYAFREGNQDCLKCHKLSEKELPSILEKLSLTDSKVLGIQMSPIKGLWEVGVENKGRRFVIYVDFAKKYITPGPLIDYATRKDLTRARNDELNKDRKVNMAALSLQNALLMGKADAPIKVAVFTDPG